ncbi:phage replisome organizer N-terminal domain-containing protein [Psychrobacillus psychrodurans]|uniref:phage replisome organizer N-terminal domain-containing protein n=1 Tax=Psychrobacillus psychrodurans TaxID=126157 RepID=UPI0008E911A2|nr:phage replisome organizer N-terminal domain-containing protein [Psychrobacillus psychrodurans]MCZ8541987.1 phage replisome organizer N-terminal domain-containing protein [Psychrobacillus psychrodurans]SFN13658.1 phage replisome organizer, putative, N-terminal region [Psychrobacillus psychrodurans]
MSDVKWIKLSTKMFEDEKIKLIEQMPEADTLLVIWIKLLSQAGRANDHGYIYLAENIPYTEEMLSTIFNRPLNIVRMALGVFRQFGMIEIDEANFISICNWEKHQNVAGLDKIREQNRLRKQKERERKKLELPSPTGHVTVTQGHATEQETELELEEELDKDKDLNQQQTSITNPNSTISTIGEVVGYKDVINFVNNNIQPVTPYIGETIDYWLKDMSSDVVLEALKLSIESNARSKIKYTEGILKNWSDQLVKTIDDVKKLNAKPSSNKPSLFQPSEEALKREEDAIREYEARMKVNV